MWNKWSVGDKWYCVVVTFLHAPLQIFLLNKIYTNTPVPLGGGGSKFFIYIYYMPIQYWTSEEKLTMVLLIVTTVVLYLTKKTPFGFLWRWYKLFWAVLFAYLMVGFTKDRVKKWWNE
jgi:hypothetical protein